MEYFFVNIQMVCDEQITTQSEINLAVINNKISKALCCYYYTGRKRACYQGR